MTLSSYRPGGWFGVFGSATTLLLPGSEKARVGALWARIDDGAGFDVVLDELLQSGLGTLPGFVLLSAGEGPTKLLARGRVVVTGRAGGEDLRIDGSAALTWVERTLVDVESLCVVVDAADAADMADVVDVADVADEAGEEPDLPILGGLVRVSRIDQPAVRSAVEPPEEPVVVLPVAADEAEGSSPLEEPPLEPVDHDGLTRTGRSGEEFSRELPGIPGQPQPPRVGPPVARLLISNGEAVEVDRVVLIGRAPEARRFTSTDQPRLVKVPSPLHEISSTHVEVRPGSGADHGSAVVTDMGSTNGTVVDQPGLGPETLRPGIAVQLMPGATINLGDGVSIQVLRP